MSGHREGQKYGKKYLCPEIKVMSKKIWRVVQPCKSVLGIFPEVPEGGNLMEKYWTGHNKSHYGCSIFLDKVLLGLKSEIIHPKHAYFWMAVAATIFVSQSAVKACIGAFWMPG